MYLYRLIHDFYLINIHQVNMSKPYQQTHKSIDELEVYIIKRIKNNPKYCEIVNNLCNNIEVTKQ